jgi:2,3-bisphosphoglycerate-independent phosphoglycerate mutase
MHLSCFYPLCSQIDSTISKRPGLQKKRIRLREDGKLADLSPTMLDIMGIDIPGEMTGNILYKNT